MAGTAKFPVNFPVSRELVTETGSIMTGPPARFFDSSTKLDSGRPLFFVKYRCRSIRIPLKALKVQSRSGSFCLGASRMSV
jgi:hypothetical protein